MASNGKDSSKVTTSIDSLKLSSRNTSKCSSKHASSESVLSKKEKECLQMQECKKKLLGMEPQIIIRDENVVLRSPPQKKIVMPPTINPEELAASTPTQRNWRGILIALLVIAAVLGLIVFSIALLTPAPDGGRVKGRRPTLHHLLHSHYKPFNGTWLSENNIDEESFGLLTDVELKELIPKIGPRLKLKKLINSIKLQAEQDLTLTALMHDFEQLYPQKENSLFSSVEIHKENIITKRKADHTRDRNLKTNIHSLIALINDEELVFRDRWGGLTLFNAKNFTTRLLMNNSTFRELNAVDFKVSADLKYVLLISDVRPGWKHARLARYHVYDVINRNKIPISPVEDDRSAPLLQYAEWSPVGSTLIFVHDNDIYYKPWVLKRLICRITNNGIPGVIFNGVPDFLYETEVLRLDKALWYSPDGQTLMFVTYNDTAVQEYRYPWYGLDQPEPPAYPEIRSLRYPKVNTENPVVTVNVVSLKTPKFLFPHPLQFTPQVDRTWYIRWTGWMSEKQVAVLLLNRPQNVSIISACSALNYNCQDIYRDETDGSRWSGLGAEPSEEDCGYCGGGALLPFKTGVFTSAPLVDAGLGSAEGGGVWRHAVKITAEGMTTITLGNYEITQLVGWDERRKLLYLLGTLPDKPGERHLLRVAIPTEAGMWPPPPACLTCPGADVTADVTTTDTDVTEIENATSSVPWWPTSTVLPHVADENDTLPEECLYNRVIFSTNFSYYVHECLGPGPPATFLCAAGAGAGATGAGGTGAGRRLTVLWDGKALRQKFAALKHPQQKVFRVEVQADREARVRLLLPPGFRETDDLPLPLVLHVSAEPGRQLVTERWAPGWGWYLAAARNFIVAEIDARGSAGQGEDMRTEIYHKLLSVDVEDQIAVLYYLRDNLKMVDGTRVGVWGRGYGGGAAAALAADDVRNVTRCLAALAPLTDLRHHVSYWTERYGGWGVARGGALGAGAVWRRAGNLPPRRVLLAHGVADLAAHAHHALALAHALVKANALYTHQVYPDEGHDFERSTIHLHRTMEQFFDECFGPVEVADWDAGGVGGLFPFRD